MIQDITIRSQNGIIYDEQKIRASENQYVYLSEGDIIISENIHYRVLRKEYDIDGKAIAIIVRRQR
jgi:hypothetical protein